MKPVFFKPQAEFAKWLEKNHLTESELLVGFFKLSATKKGITYKEALDEALCFGWIDGIRKGFDEISYTIRFTPRKARSIWSNINIAHVERLKKEGKMKEAGLKAYDKRSAAKSGIYSFEQKVPATLDKISESKFRKNKKAWEWFSAKAPSYKKVAIFWIMSAKKEETKQSRLNRVIEDSEKNKILDHLNSNFYKEKKAAAKK